MAIFLKEDTKAKLKILAYYQIAGGIFGIGLTIWLIATTEIFSGLLLLIYILAAGLYSFSIYCGQQLLKRNLKRGLRISTINQILQTINFAMFGYAFMYVAGLSFSIGLDMTGAFNFTFNFTFPSVQFSFNSEPDILKFGVNVVAIYAMYYIERLQDQVERNRQLFSTSQQEILDSELVKN